MKFKIFLVLFILGLTTTGLAMFFQSAPGYMDADYYYAVGKRLVSGEGFTESWLWNYLDDPNGLPHSAHKYWMPLASMLSALSMLFFHKNSYEAARLLFWFVSGLIPPLTARIAYEYENDNQKAWLAGLISLFPGFYLVYLPVTDSFSPSMLLGGLWFLNFLRLKKQSEILDGTKSTDLLIFTLGLLSGLLHLLRVEGFIWLLLGFLSIFCYGPKKRICCSRKEIIQSCMLISGYMLIMLPWLFFESITSGSIFTLGGNPSIWITSYDDLFHYPAKEINFQRWINSGIIEIARSRFWALGQNIMTLIVIQASIYLLPILIIAIIHKRKDLETLIFLTFWLMLFFLMTVVFPFQGARGGYFHGGASLQPVIWSLVPIGLSILIKGGVKKRGWQYQKAWSLFGATIIIMNALITIYVGYQRVIGSDLFRPAWNHSFYQYQMVESILEDLDPSKEEIIMVNNPPGYYIAGERQAIVIPDGDEEIVKIVAKRYSAKFLLLDINHPASIKNLYFYPHSRPGFEYINSFDGFILYKIE